MRLRYGPSVIIQLVILLCSVSQGRGGILLLTDAWPSIEGSTKPREGAGISAVSQSPETLPPKQVEVEHPPQRVLSSEAENVLLLLLGIVLLLTFTVSRLWLSKHDREPAKLDKLKN